MALNLWKTILPKSRAFNLTIDKKLRQFFEGLSFPDDFRKQADNVFDNINPQHTQNLEKWEDQFYLRNYGLTEQERRDRLEATWKLTGGQSPAYLQSILRSYGFGVTVYDWWQEDEQQNEFTMGSNISFMGEEFAFMGANFGVYPAPHNPNDLLIPPYYPLVNKISAFTSSPISMAGTNIVMGGDMSMMGIGIETISNFDYPLPNDPKRWRHFIYVAGVNINEPAYVPLSRKDELEELILSIFPAGKWVGMIVEYDGQGVGLQEMLQYNDIYNALSADYLLTSNNLVS